MIRDRPSVVQGALCLALGLLLACQERKAVDFDVPPGMPVADPAQLEGTFGAVVELATILTLPIFGERDAGSQNLWLHTREWDAAAGVFHESMRWCGMDVWEVEGMKLTVPQATLDLHPAVTFDSTLDAAQGYYRVQKIVDLWGLRDMPDPEHTALPTHSTWQDSPQKDWVWDEDQDGKPATTGHTTGLTAGEVHEVVRGIYGLEGWVLDLDRLRGVAAMMSYQQNVLESNNQFAVGESHLRQDPDERRSWFEMVRLPAGSDCAEVRRAQEDGRLAKSRPF